MTSPSSELCASAQLSDPVDFDQAPGDGAPACDDIAQHLVRHGAHVEVAEVASHGSPIAQVILGYAVQSASDLLVVGAYSHARLRELLLGDATRTLLACMPVPVLISR
jgi:nucleotide-binding universal stress UspA family protein